MKKNDKWIKVLYDFDKPGKIKEVECINHSYSFSGKMPNTGIKRCIFCGKPEEV